MTDATARFHVRFGWLALAVFVTVGLVLEALHGFKLGWYVDVGAENRRLMLTLGHAHGSLLGLLNLGFAASARFLPDALPRNPNGKILKTDLRALVAAELEAAGKG